MIIVYNHQEIPHDITKSLFLCGGSLRPGQEGVSWRKDALQILNDIGYDGVVFVPENPEGVWDEDFDYEAQVTWERKCLNIADCIVFWVDRDLSSDAKGNLKLPAFTTNVEFGSWVSSGKVVFGGPENGTKNQYLEHYADLYKVPIAHTLIDTLRQALQFLGEGAARAGGEVGVPLFIWKTPSFQSWYDSHKAAGNRLDGAELLYNFRPQYKKFVFLWILKVNVWIEAEQRSKVNEFVLARPDIASVLLWKRASEKEESEIVIIKEFRSPANTQDGFVRELPGGSSADPEEMLDTASHEVFEETGFHLDPNRLVPVATRQLAGTFSAHKAHVFQAEITEEELTWLRSQEGIPHGNFEDSERTFIEIFKVKDLLSQNIFDWSTLGMVLSVIYYTKHFA